MQRRHPGLRNILLAGLTASFTACGTIRDARGPEEVYDPFEESNRSAFQNYLYLDSHALRPAALTYRSVVSDPVRKSIHNFLSNVTSLQVFTNDLLRGRIGSAGTTLLRTTINSSIGIGGLFDVAGAWGLNGHSDDFGKTLAAYGVGEGPYLFFTFLGPSNVRDFAGTIVDLFINPFILLGGEEALIAISSDQTLSTLEKRERETELLDYLRVSSADAYARVRDAYTQSRRSEIRSELGQEEQVPDF